MDHIWHVPDHRKFKPSTTIPDFVISDEHMNRLRDEGLKKAASLASKKLKEPKR